jgi:hypothetical protein
MRRDRREQQQLALAAAQISGKKAVDENHDRAGHSRWPATRALRPLHRRSIRIGRISGGNDDRSWFVGRLAQRAQLIEGCRQRELGAAETGDEIAAPYAARILHRLEHQIHRGESSGDGFTGGGLTRHDAAALHSVVDVFVARMVSTADQRPSAVGGTRRRERNGVPRDRRAARASEGRVKARSGCSVSLVTRPCHTRSHKASTVSCG